LKLKKRSLFIIILPKMQYKITHHTKTINATIDLPTSKSISNRLLIIRALCQQNFTIHKLATADDSQLLLKALNFNEAKIDVGAAGTSSRFLTALLAITKGNWYLCGTERLHKRPIETLVNALINLGADITYAKKEGYLPLNINGKMLEGGKINIAGTISSQFISALLMIAPTLKKGLQLNIKGNLVSTPYVQMTLKLMQNFGIAHTWEAHQITIAPQQYKAKDYTVEADWSAASYFFTIAALAKQSKLLLNGLFENSVQGDQQIQQITDQLGIKSFFMKPYLHLIKAGPSNNKFIFDFTECPDLAQTVAVYCAALGIGAQFTGLQTLRRKETDRIAALQNELAKIGVSFTSTDEIHFELSGKADLNLPTPTFETYEDHRMAMAFAPLALILPEIIIEDPMVVSKSYPNFYKDLEKMGFEVAEIS